MKIIVIGAVNIDIIGKTDQPFKAETSNIGQVSISVGGVGRNMARQLASLGHEVEMLTVIPETFFGELIEASLFRDGIGFLHALKGDFEDSLYLALEEADGELVGGVNQMESILELDARWIQEKLKVLSPYDLVVAETNLPVEVLQALARMPREVPLAVEGVSVQKVVKLSNLLDGIDILKVNEMEARALAGDSGVFSPKDLALWLMDQGLGEVHLTRGAQGSLVGRQGEVSVYGAAPAGHVESVNRAGDVYFAGILDRWLAEESLDEQVRFACELVGRRLRGED